MDGILLGRSGPVRPHPHHGSGLLRERNGHGPRFGEGMGMGGGVVLQGGDQPIMRPEKLSEICRESM